MDTHRAIINANYKVKIKSETYRIIPELRITLCLWSMVCAMLDVAVSIVTIEMMSINERFLKIIFIFRVCI